ncbi:spore gernimation protein [Bacillus sp. FJAT-18017]|uniref:spore germination protein GerPB n=1 Tax=Bacillus sp. FJAT-18017 TaxID=1705566 RepID=UPI0006ADAFD9|nr:spore germination protein GerPB [Bacillus sp. FJAT-18017]ALC91914.1 spore gernimation protein [Bacillus sp. FJAT-18017]
MNIYIQQSITIQSIRIGGISNSSVFQIGSSGIIKPASHLSNTGGFTGPAPKTQKPFQLAPQQDSGGQLPLTQTPAVPL